MTAADVRGSAIVVVVGVILVLSAMGLALVLLSISETMAAGNTARASVGLYAAQAGIERVLPDLWHLPDWDAALGGSLVSGFTDGPPHGARTLPGGRRIDLDEIVSLANCGSPTPCSASAIVAITADRPWGDNNPRWQLFAYGPLASLVEPGDWPPAEYLVVLVADDPAENDGDPLHDGRGSNPGAGLMLVRAEAFGSDSAHRVVEATVARGSPGRLPSGYVAQRGQGTTTAGPPVQVPGGAISRVGMTLDGGFSRQ